MTVRIAAASDGGFVRYGVKEEMDDGRFMETYGLNLGGGNIGRETLTFNAKSQAVAIAVNRPLGIVFEEVDGWGGREGSSSSPSMRPYAVL